MKKSFILLSFFTLCVSLNNYAQEKNIIPVNIKSLNESISQKSLTGSIELSSMEVESSALSDILATTPNCQVTAPTTLAQLTGGWKIFFYNMTLETAAKVGVVSIAEAQTNIGKEVYVYEQMNYKDLDNCKNGKITYGAGVRLTILAKKLDASANLSNLGAIAASAEFKKAEVTVTMSTIGLSGPKITATIPPAGSYSVEKHVQYLQAIDAIKEATADSTTIVTPEIISLSIPPSSNSEFLKATYITFALERIAKRESFNTAKTKIETWSDLTDAMFRQVYTAIVGGNDDKKPSEINVLQAKEILKDTH
ncbi:hypothetical protein [Flavobacterium sp. N2820]|jgi:hypothetical protein|uniref:hypothetical protein n=1 Tax=Flavobacterium sp. N2820 TaxID=2986834 RepID=UPI002224FCBA|nr:hypothetical protein [Flavobacterium sp. N2820]